MNQSEELVAAWLRAHPLLGLDGELSPRRGPRGLPQGGSAVPAAQGSREHAPGLLTRAADWDRFVAAGCQAGLAGLLLEHATGHDAALPDEVSAKLRRQAVAVAANHVSLACGLERAVAALNAADVDVMLLKGAALTLTTYARADLRPMADIDLLVRPKSTDAAVKALLNHGFQRGCDLVRDDFFPKYHYELELLSDPPAAVRIDLHARPFRPLRVSRTMPDDALWEAALPVQVGRAHALIPNPEFMLIHLGVHAAFHGCSRLLWLYDIARWVAARGGSMAGATGGSSASVMDWELIADRARRWRLSLPLLQSLERTAELFGPIVPSTLTAELASHRTNWQDRMTLRCAPRDADSAVSHVAVNLLCTPGVRFKAGYLAALLWPGHAHLGEVYPFRHIGWVPCAHGWRILRTLGRLASTLIQLVWRVVRSVTFSRTREPPTTAADAGATGGSSASVNA